MHHQLRKLLEGVFVDTTDQQPTPDAPVTNLTAVVAANAISLIKKDMPELALDFLSRNQDQKKTERLKGLLGLVYMNKYLRDNPQPQVYGPVSEDFHDRNIITLQHKIEQLKVAGRDLNKASPQYLLKLICLYDAFKRNLNADKFPEEVSAYDEKIKTLATRKRIFEKKSEEQCYFGA